MNFKGSLEGINIEDLKEADGDKDKNLLVERKEVLNSKYNKVGKFYETFTSDVYNPNLKENEELSHEINIFSFLERDGSYLLGAIDVVKDKVRDKHITKTNVDYDKSLTQKATKNHSNFEVAIASTFEANTTKYINDETVITESDYKNNDYGSILQDYQNAREVLINKMLLMQKRIVESEGNNTEEITHSLNQLKALISNLNQDMILTKEAYKGLTTYTPKENTSHYVSPSYKLDVIDYSKPKHIKAIIKEVDLFQNELIVNDGISEISYDITNTILNLHKKGILNDYELLLVRLKNSSNLDSVEIAHILGKCRKTVHNNYNAIVKKICTHNKKDK